MVNSRGFTLLEILMAMAIFTLIGLASTAVLTSVIDSDEISTQRFEKLQSLQRAMLTIERDILQATPRAVRLEGESNSVVFTGGNDQFQSESDGIGFTRAGWQNPQLMLPRSTLQGVAYRLQDGQLQKLYSNYVDNVIGFEPKVKVVMEDIEDFQIEYLASKGKDPTESDSWSESYVGESLPIAVAVIIESRDFGLIRREFQLTEPNIVSNSGGNNPGDGSGDGSGGDRSVGDNG